MKHTHIALIILAASIAMQAPLPAEAAEYRAYLEPSGLSVPAGGESYISLIFEIPPGHHIYGNPLGPGTGKPTTVRPAKSYDGITFRPTRYPGAKVYFSPGDRGYVRIYEKSARLFIPLEIDRKAAPGERRISLLVDSLLCNEGTCIPREFTLDFTLRVLAANEKGTVHGADITALFAAAKEAGDDIVLERPGGQSSVQANIPYDFQPRYVSAGDVTNVLQAILFGLLAGLILNFMPCVLPVVSLKVMNFVTMGHDDPRKVLKIGVLFSLGILTVFLVLASLAAFLGYGWGELFKKKEFIIGMIGIIFALALSMFDVFTITPPSVAGKPDTGGVHPYVDAYAKGLLATLLATPCSGPFLGGTLAWALTRPPLTVFVIFVSVGVGMALPYLVLAARPSLLKFVPKPGEWTITLERIMGFLLTATVVYLTGVLEAGLVLPTLWFLLFVFAGFWQYGKYGSVVNPRLTRALSAASLVVIVAGGYWMSYHSGGGGDTGPAHAAGSEFSLRRLADNNAAGKISIVKFTADWCPNCSLVERTSLYTERVMKLVRDSGADLMVADITRHNPEAEALMKKLGTRSIPFLAVFPSGDQFLRPWCLRDMYSEGDVAGSIEKAMKAVPDIDIDSIRFSQ